MKASFVPEDRETDLEDRDLFSVRILLFSVLRERIGQSVIHLTVEAPSTAGGLVDRLAEHFPAVAPFRSSVKVAVNETYVPETHPLSDGDEIALITPVSGG